MPPSPFCICLEKGKFVARSKASATLFGEGLSLSRRPVLVQDLACRDRKEVEHTLLPYPALQPQQERAQRRLKLYLSRSSDALQQKGAVHRLIAHAVVIVGSISARSIVAVHAMIALRRPVGDS